MLKKLAETARQIRINSLKAIHAAKSGHPGGCLSCADILAVLYGEVMGEDDHFILSKGHAAPALYAVLAEQGVIEREELLNLRKLGSLLQGHPYISCPGVETSTGSLGQGLSVAVGMAFGMQKVGLPGRVFVLVGDGELEEGICWEAFNFAHHFNVSNLIVIIDRNGLRSDGLIMTSFISKKLKAFGMQVELVNGHDLPSLTLSFLDNQGPKAIVASTIKGKGISFMEGRHEWHGSVELSDKQLQVALDEL